MKYRFAAGRTVRNITKGIAFSGDSFLMDCSFYFLRSALITTATAP